VYELSHLDEKKFWSMFRVRGTLTKKKSKQIICSGMTIHTTIESLCQIWSVCDVFKKKIIVNLGENNIKKQVFNVYFCIFE
jgi:hypothetical protein